MGTEEEVDAVVDDAEEDREADDAGDDLEDDEGGEDGVGVEEGFAPGALDAGRDAAVDRERDGVEATGVGVPA